VDEQPCALDVPQELQSQPGTLAGTFDQAGDVRQHKAAPVDVHYPQVGRQRGERIIRDLGASGADAGQESGLAGVRLAHQAHVGNEFQFQSHVPLFTGLAALRKVGRLARRGLEGSVAAPTAPTLGHDDGLSLAGQIREHLPGSHVVNDRPHRDVDNEVVAVWPVLVVAAAVAPVSCPKVAPFGKEHQRVHAGHGTQHDVAAGPPVAAVGSSERHMLLAAKTGQAVPAVAAPHGDGYLVKKHPSPLGCDPLPARLLQVRPAPRRGLPRRARRAPAGGSGAQRCPSGARRRRGWPAPP